LKKKGQWAEHARKMQLGAPRLSAARDARLWEATRAGAPTSQTFSLDEPLYSFAIQHIPPIQTTATITTASHRFFLPHQNCNSQLDTPRHRLRTAHPAHRRTSALGPSDLLLCCLFAHSLHQAQSSVTCLFYFLYTVTYHQWTTGRISGPVAPSMLLVPRIHVSKANRAPALASSLCLCRTRSNKTRNPTIPSAPFPQRNDSVATRHTVVETLSTVCPH
jgi:hypothetical protein